MRFDKLTVTKMKKAILSFACAELVEVSKDNLK
jgi:hypothetical protein